MTSADDLCKGDQGTGARPRSAKVAFHGPCLRGFLHTLSRQRCSELCPGWQHPLAGATFPGAPQGTAGVGSGKSCQFFIKGGRVNRLVQLLPGWSSKCLLLQSPVVLINYLSLRVKNSSFCQYHPACWQVDNPRRTEKGGYIRGHAI